MLAIYEVRISIAPQRSGKYVQIWPVMYGRGQTLCDCCGP